MLRVINWEEEEVMGKHGHTARSWLSLQARARGERGPALVHTQGLATSDFFRLVFLYFYIFSFHPKRYISKAKSYYNLDDKVNMVKTLLKL